MLVLLGAGESQIEATSLGASSVLARIVTLMKEAQGSQAPIQRLADRISAIFVPAVVSIAIATFALWMIVPVTVLPIYMPMPLAFGSVIEPLLVTLPVIGPVVLMPMLLSPVPMMLPEFVRSPTMGAPTEMP